MKKLHLQISVLDRAENISFLPPHAALFCNNSSTVIVLLLKECAEDSGHVHINWPW